jgi:hypothetical protein
MVKKAARVPDYSLASCKVCSERALSILQFTIESLGCTIDTNIVLWLYPVIAEIELILSASL